MQYTAPVAEKFAPDVVNVLLASAICWSDAPACDEGEWDIVG